MYGNFYGGFIVSYGLPLYGHQTIPHTNSSVPNEGSHPSHLGGRTSFSSPHAPPHVKNPSCSGASTSYGTITSYGHPHPKNPHYPFLVPFPRSLAPTQVTFP
jgi:hypothetical protein